MPWKNTSTWAPEHDTELERLIASGLSFSQVADALTDKFDQPFTRNAVGGRASRRKIAAAPVAATNARSAAALGNGNRKKKTVDITPPAPPKFTAEQVQLRCVEIVPHHLSLLDLQPNDCRYPYGDSSFTFCGHPQIDGSSYCLDHLNLTRKAAA